MKKLHEKAVIWLGRLSNAFPSDDQRFSPSPLSFNVWVVIVPTCEGGIHVRYRLLLLKSLQCFKCKGRNAWVSIRAASSASATRGWKTHQHLPLFDETRHAHTFLPCVHEFTWDQSSPWQFSGAARKSGCGAEIWCDVNCSKRTAETDWVVTRAEIFHSSVMTFGSVRSTAEDAVNNVLNIILCSSEGFGANSLAVG